MDPEWTAKAQKHGYGINTENATKEELGEYIETKMYVYGYRNFTDYTLWALFQEDFEDFTADTFRKVQTDTRARLRTHLLRRGVYVAAYNKRNSISKVLADTIAEEEFHKWTDEEITSTLIELGSMASISLRKRLNPAQDSLIGAPRPPPADPPQPPPPEDQQPPPEDHQPPPPPPPPPATDGAANPTYQKEAATIAKIYTDDQKYDGVSDSFDFKLTIFYDICKRSGLPPEGYLTVLPTMLKGLAQDHYYNSNLSARSFTEACDHIRGFFEGPEYYRKNLTEWNATNLQEIISKNPCYLTDVELQRLHRRFGHPSVERLQRVLDRAGHDIDKKTLEHLTKYCHYCQKHSKSPGRFRFTLRDDVEFNYCIIVDIMYISGSPLLHVVDEGTRFQAGRWLQNISAKHTWEVLRMCWIDTYLGPPDLITSDAGKNFVSKEFKEYANTIGIRTKAVPVEAHNSIGMVERYHGPLRRVYQIIVVELPGIDRDAALQMAFKALNDTAGPDGLVPTLLVFGAYPRMTELDAPSPTVTQRANAVKKAMAEIRKLRAERQVADALNMRNGPRTDAVHDLPPNSPVLIWREGNTGHSGHWDGPFTLLTVEGETCTIELTSGPTPFRSTVVKPYLQPESTEEPTPHGAEEHAEPTRTDEPAPPPQEAAPQPVQKRGRGRPRKYPLLTAAADITIYLQDDATRFSASRQKELTGLLEKGVFEITKLTNVPQGVRLFNSRFVDEVKNKGTDKAFEKSRLVVQAYNDAEKDLVLTQSPTIQRVSQRLILCIAAMELPKAQLYLRDISQAYVQSTTNLNREFYVRPPRELSKELGIDKDSILKVVKPLYGVPEAGNHWFKTYHSHHIKQSHMSQSTYDPCLLYSNEPFGIVGLQTDDTLFLADESFAGNEQSKLHKAEFMAKEREQLTIDTPIKFNGGLIQLAPDRSIAFTQERQCKNLNTVNIKPANSTSSRGVTRNLLTPKDQYIAQRARGAYIASVCQPEASFDLSFAAQVINPVESDAKTLNRRLSWQIENANRGLKFVKLDIKTLQLLVFTDASFANNKDLSSQIGYVIVLADATKKANIVHWSSVKCKRVTRSVLASELYGTTHGFDISLAIKSTVDKILQINLPLVLCTDSKSLYDCLVRLGTTQEKRLMIDVMCLRQAYERRQIAEIKWIDGESNPADAMTKGKPCAALTQLIDTNQIDLQAVGWVERKDGSIGG